MSGPASLKFGPVRLGELARKLGLELRGDPDVAVDSAATLVAARPGQISFLGNPAYREQLPTTRASAVIVAANVASNAPCAALIAGDPHAAWARLLTLLYHAPPAAY